MARGYTRPDVPDSLYEEIADGRVILINPESKDLADALETVQHRARERRLTKAAVQDAWRRFNDEALAGVGLCKATEAPEFYRWALYTTLFQAVRITDELTGAILQRAAIEPGQRLRWPVPGATGIPDEDARWQGSAIDRRNDIVTAFWLHLSDEDIQSLDAHTAAA